MHQAELEGLEVTALGHDGFLVSSPDGKVRIAFDPYDVRGVEPANIIFISHSHFDHCDPRSIHLLSTTSTKIVAPACCQQELQEFSSQLELVTDNQKHELPGLTYWTVPAYNINKFRTPNEVFHPKSLGGVGFVVEIEVENERKVRLYHAGDTDLIPEMQELKKIAIAFLPISGTFVMTLEEAVKAAEVISPKVVVPMHFGKLLGSATDAHRYEHLLTGKVPVTVLSIGE